MREVEAGRHDESVPLRNTRFGEFWFGRLLSLMAAVFIFGSTAAAFAAGMRGAEAVKLLTEAFWTLLALVLVYNGRAVAHDRLMDVIRSARKE